MKNSKKRICALLLVLALLLPLLSTAAPLVSAEEPGEETAAAVLPELKKAGKDGKETRRTLPRGGTAEPPVRGEIDFQELSLDTEYVAVINEPDGYVWLSFTPAESSRYVLSASSGRDSYCELYDADFNFLQSDDDSGDGLDFMLRYYLESNQTYYFLVHFLGDETGSIPVILSSYTIPTSGSCGEELFWEFDSSSGLLTISGYGWMYDWGWEEDVPWFDLAEQITAISLPEGLCSIGELAFVHCQISSVEIPEGVETIGPQAFGYCFELQEVTLPASVRYFGFAAFGYCTNLEKILVDAENPNFSSRDGVLFSSDQTELVECPAGMTGSYSVPDSVERIKEGAFYGCELLSAISIPVGVTGIGGNAFCGCSYLTEIYLPEGLETIEDNLFYNCYSLTEVEIPESVKSIHFFAFAYCDGLTEMLIPGNVEQIDYEAFYACSNLECVTVLNRSCSIDYDPNTLGYPETTTLRGAANSTVQGYAEEFEYNFELIDPCDYDCHVYELADELPHTDVEPGWRLWHCVECGKDYLETTPAGHVFSCVDDSTWMHLMQCEYCDLNYSEDCSFDIVPDEEYFIQLTENKKAEWARFVPDEDCIYVIESTGPADSCCTLYNDDGSVISSDDDGGNGSNFRLVIELMAGETYYYKLNCFNDRSGSYTVRLSKFEMQSSGQCGPDLYWEVDTLTDTLVIEGSGEMYNFGDDESFDVTQLPWYFFYSNISAVSLPEGLTSIGNNAFFGFRSLTSVELPASLQRIGHDAFSGSALSGIVIPDSVTELGAYAFDYCNELQSIQFPAGLREIPEYICYNCRNLTEIKWPAALTEISRGAFAYCGMDRIEFPKDLETIEEYAFMYCQDLEKIILPSGLKRLGFESFLRCPVMHEVTVPSSVTNIANFALGYLSDGAVGAARGDIDGEIEKVEGFTIRGVSGSEAERYAIDNEFIFIPIVEFSDVAPGSWYYNAVQWAVENGITSGTGDGKFSPKKTCTREQVMAFLWKAEGSPLPTISESPFTDVVPGKYYFKPVLWAVENKITGGVSSTLFGVGRGCTREQVVSFIWKAVGSPEPETTESPFTDVTAGKYYYKAVLWAVENGITSGTGEGVFGVGKTCNRAQIVTFLYAAAHCE